jgi:hypothetical protein
MFVEELISCINEGREYSQDVFFARLTEFENQWAANEQNIEYNQPVDYIMLSKEILRKYKLSEEIL